MVKEHSDLPAI